MILTCSFMKAFLSDRSTPSLLCSCFLTIRSVVSCMHSHMPFAVNLRQLVRLESGKGQIADSKPLK